MPKLALETDKRDPTRLAVTVAFRADIDRFGHDYLLSTLRHAGIISHNDNLTGQTEFVIVSHTRTSLVEIWSLVVTCNEPADMVAGRAHEAVISWPEVRHWRVLPVPERGGQNG